MGVINVKRKYIIFAFALIFVFAIGFIFIFNNSSEKVSYLGWSENVNIPEGHFVWIDATTATESSLHIYLYRENDVYSYLEVAGRTIYWGGPWEFKILNKEYSLSLDALVKYLKNHKYIEYSSAFYSNKPFKESFIGSGEEFIKMLENLDEKTEDFLFNS